jgi:asparagine synthase (glutamine-hydrolysing)
VYNGELYNTETLRAQLPVAERDYTSSSDTEVLYHALRVWGIEAVERIEGMFAFAFLDPSSGRLLLARDRIGIKPLHLAFVDGGLLVASEAKGALASGLVPPALSSEGVHQVWRFNHCLGSRTALRGIETLPPGTCMTVDIHDLGRRARRYFRPRLGGPDRPAGAARIDRLDEAFVRAIGTHCVSDRPVACYLSGGIDSSGIAAAASSVLGDALTTYSMVFPGVAYNEEPAVDRFVRDYGLVNRKVPITGVSLPEFVAYVQAAEMPQWWTSDLALMKLAAGVARAGHRVVLAGEGPDEFLAGYDAYRAMRLRQALRWANPARLVQAGTLRRLGLHWVAPWVGLDLGAVSYYLERHDPALRDERVARYGFYPESVILWELLTRRHGDLLGPALRDSLSAFEAGEREFFATHVAPEVAGHTPLEANLHFEIAVRLPSWVLHMGDRMSAASGLELRFPYLDDQVVEVMLGLPERDRLRGLDEKHILRRVHARRLPRYVTWRAKQPLYTPVFDWVRDFTDDPSFERYWSPDAFARHQLFDAGAADTLLRRLQAGGQDPMDRMSCEWAFMTVLSTHVLADAATQWAQA